MLYIRPLDAIPAKDIGLIGGKAGGLNKLITGRFNVPKGFVILSTAFEYFLIETKIKNKLETTAKDFNNSIKNAEVVSNKIKNLIENREIPDTLAKEILNNFRSLETDLVAVRSSASLEDSKDFAWAGQFDTFLNTSETELLTKIKKCWSSLYTVRSLVYRQKNSIQEKDITMSIVIQEMIQSESAGVAFSVHPVSQDRNKIIIEAGVGLGEKVVSGEITPDSYVINKNNLEIIDKKIQASKQVLNDWEIIELSKNITEIEKYFNFPCDIEWAKEKDEFYILQTRHITSLPDLKLSLEVKEKNTLLNLGPIEYWAEELTPPLYGITDVLQPSFKDNFLCVFENNTVILYFINERAKEEAEIGYEFFSQNDSVDKYAQRVKEVLEEQKSLTLKKNPSLMEIIEVSRRFEAVYEMTEAVRFRKFEGGESEDIWNRFKKIAELRLELRKATRQGSNTPSDQALINLSKTSGIDRDDLFFYTYYELQNLLINNKKVSSSIILERKDGYVYWIKNGVSSLHVGKTFQEISKLIKGQVENQNTYKIVGRSASKGIARGVVQLILNNKRDIQDQIELFREGMILVTEMTRPQTLAACIKAAGIITDEGGLVSHAAITARELNIPCVIGTKMGTKILKNGDFVEVDANRGMVTILKKAEPTI